MFCKNCGMELNENAKFCAFCGVEIQENQEKSFINTERDDYMTHDKDENPDSVAPVYQENYSIKKRDHSWLFGLLLFSRFNRFFRHRRFGHWNNHWNNHWHHHPRPFRFNFKL